MKVVLFCGGYGMRLREYSESVPKPMVPIGYRPILWHVMRYYAHFGHKDFILCLGWKADFIKRYFLNYDECISNDFVLSSGGDRVSLLQSDIQDWNITFVDTGNTTSVGQRLRAVQPHLDGEEVFLANYADGLTDLHLPDLVEFFHSRSTTASFLSVKPNQSFHAVMADDDGRVEGIRPIESSGLWMNGGFFVFGREIFRYLEDGHDLVESPFGRLITEQRLSTLKYDGFWGCLDTYKEKHAFDEMHASGYRPWEVWNRPDEPVATTEVARVRQTGRAKGASGAPIWLTTRSEPRLHGLAAEEQAGPERRTATSGAHGRW